MAAAGSMRPNKLLAAAVRRKYLATLLTLITDFKVRACVTNFWMGFSDDELDMKENELWEKNILVR